MTPKWLDAAVKEIGVHEVPGSDSNPRIIHYDSFTTYKATMDEVPWCAAFVCCMLEENGVKSTGSAAAKSYLTWGKNMEPSIPGCVVVVRNKAGAYHVGFYVKDYDPAYITLLGGNQKDSVCLSHFPKSSVVACRWPWNADFKNAKTPP